MEKAKKEIGKILRKASRKEDYVCSAGVDWVSVYLDLIDALINYAKRKGDKK